MTEPACLHATREPMWFVRKGDMSNPTLYAERCIQCSVIFEYTRTTLIERHPDGTEVVSEHPHGGSLAEDDVDMSNSIRSGLKL